MRGATEGYFVFVPPRNTVCHESYHSQTDINSNSSKLKYENVLSNIQSWAVHKSLQILFCFFCFLYNFQNIHLQSKHSHTGKQSKDDKIQEKVLYSESGVLILQFHNVHCAYYFRFYCKLRPYHFGFNYFFSITFNMQTYSFVQFLISDSLSFHNMLELPAEIIPA